MRSSRAMLRRTRKIAGIKKNEGAPFFAFFAKGGPLTAPGDASA